MQDGRTQGQHFKATETALNQEARTQKSMCPVSHPYYTLRSWSGATFLSQVLPCLIGSTPMRLWQVLHGTSPSWHWPLKQQHISPTLTPMLTFWSQNSKLFPFNMHQRSSKPTPDTVHSHSLHSLCQKVLQSSPTHVITTLMPVPATLQPCPHWGSLQSPASLLR